MLRATDTHVVITLRGIGEMTPQNPDSFVRLSPTRTENSRPTAEVTLADVKTRTSNTAQSNVDKQTWDAMDALADEVALILANGQPFEILGAKGGSVPMPAGATVADLKAKHPYDDRRDPEGSTHHDAGTLWMGDDVATSVTNEFGRIHDTTNCYVDAPALFPSLGSPNPMLTGVALSRRTADLLEKNVLPRAIVRTPAPGFTALFDGTVASFKKWKLAGVANAPQSFAFLNGELASYGSSDFSLLYYAAKAFDDFHLRLQFRVFDPANCNSGVFIRFLDPLQKLPDGLRTRATNEGAPIDSNPAWSAVFSGFEVQIDDNARGDVNKDYYGRRPEPDGLYKNRTGAIYKIPAGDLIIHTGGHDVTVQHYTPGPPTRVGVWMQYDIVVTGNHYEVTLTDTETGVSQLTTTFDNTDTERGVAKVKRRSGRIHRHPVVPELAGGVSRYLDQVSSPLTLPPRGQVRDKSSVQQQIVDDLQRSRDKKWQADQRRPPEHQSDKLSLSETPFSLRRWQLSDADPVVRSPFDAGFDVPLTRCAGVGEHGSPAPDRCP